VVSSSLDICEPPKKYCGCNVPFLVNPASSKALPTLNPAGTSLIN